VIYVAMARPPDDALEVFVVARQWMWKLQHLSGRREINELHVPVGRPVKLTMTSEDVIHSFFVPAFRVKADVLPGRYTTLWFEATKEGVYHLFCTEYCGTEHSRMIGRVVAMPGAEYQQWLTGTPVAAGLAAATPRGGTLSMAAMGEQIFDRNGCRTCHATSPSEGATATTGPPLYGLFGRSVELEAGFNAVAEEGYLRRSIVDPMADIVRGYRPMMPTYAGRLSEEEVLQLVAYIKSLAAEHRLDETRGPAATETPAGDEGWAPAPGEAPPAEIPTPGSGGAKPGEDS
jgi:cytochrome c oxidase subunit 2